MGYGIHIIIALVPRIDGGLSVTPSPFLLTLCDYIVFVDVYTGECFIFVIVEFSDIDQRHSQQMKQQIDWTFTKALYFYILMCQPSVQ